MKKRILISIIKNKEGETIKTRQRIANVFAKFYEDLYEGQKDFSQKGTDSRTEVDGEDLEQNNSIKEFAKNEIQDAIDRLQKKGKRKTEMEYELNSLRTVVRTRKKNQDNLQRNCAAR